MARLHTWAGLLPGWLLFTVFLFGTTAFFHQEINGWMRPELRSEPVTAMALDAAGTLAERRAEGGGAKITLPGARGGGISVSWMPQGGDLSGRHEALLDPSTGREIVVRDTRGGAFLYAFHYNLYYMPWWLGRYIVLAASLAMLVALLSGIVTHRKIFSDFFLLRFGKGQRSWLDAHNVTAVLALPFHLMITYTGLVTLLFTAMPWAISANFPNVDDFQKAVYPPSPQTGASGRAAPFLRLSELVARARAERGGIEPRIIAISNPGNTGAVVEMWPRVDMLASPRGALYLDATTGSLLQGPRERGKASHTESVMVDLHAGRFSGPVMRWFYFLSGVGGTMMIATGLVLWTVKRRAKLPDPARPHFGFRLVERLNIGVIVGSCAGIAAYFLANRLLPLGMANRADWEINSLFIAWGGLFVWTLARPAKRAWVETLAVCAALYALVPIINALTTARGLVPSLIARDWVFVGFDGVMLAMAAACAFTAWKVATHTPKAGSRRRPHELVEAAL